MKILHVGKYYPPEKGGIETVTHDIVEECNSIKGIDVHADVLCFNTVCKYVENKHSNYTVYRTRSYGKLFSVSISPQYYFKLKKLYRLYDILHVHMPNPLAVLAIFLIRPNKKIILQWHSDILRQKKLLFFYKPLLKFILQRSNLIIASSNNYIKGSPYLTENKNKIIVIPFGIDCHHLKINLSVKQQIQKKFFGKKIIFSLGRLIYYKGFQYLIEAAHYLSDDYVIVIGGSGPLQEKLQNMITINNLANRVMLLGEIPDNHLGAYYDSAYLYCMSSYERSEAFGIVLLEAMFMGKPVVATNIAGSGVNWVNQHNLTGYNVEPENPVQLADAIKKIGSDPSLYKKFALNSKKRFNTYFKKKYMMKKIMDVYIALAKNNVI